MWLPPCPDVYVYTPGSSPEATTVSGCPSPSSARARALDLACARASALASLLDLESDLFSEVDVEDLVEFPFPLAGADCAHAGWIRLSDNPATSIAANAPLCPRRELLVVFPSFIPSLL